MFSPALVSVVVSSPILEQSSPEDKPSEAAERSLKAQGTIIGEGVSLPQQNQTFSLTQTSCSISRYPLVPLALHDHTAEASRDLNSSTKPSWSIYQSPERPRQTNSNGELHSNSMRLVREPLLEHLNGTGLQVNCSSGTKPGCSIYQSPERSSQPEPGQDLHSHSMHLVREPKSNRFNATSLQASTTKPSWHIYQSPEGTSRAGSKGELSSTSMHLANEHKLNQRKSTGLQFNLDRSLNPSTRPTWSIYQSPERASQARADQLSSTSRLSVREPMAGSLRSGGHLNRSGLQPLGVDVRPGRDGADLLLPEKGPSQDILQDNRDLSRQSCGFPSSPKPEPRAVQDIPMSPDPPLGSGWLKVDSRSPLVENDLDVMVR